MKTDLYIGKGRRLSFHICIVNKYLWEFHVLPFIDISEWRILTGWLCFTIQWTYQKDQTIQEFYENE